MRLLRQIPQARRPGVWHAPSGSPVTWTADTSACATQRNVPPRLAHAMQREMASIMVRQRWWWWRQSRADGVCIRTCCYDKNACGHHQDAVELTEEVAGDRAGGGRSSQPASMKHKGFNMQGTMSRGHASRCWEVGSWHCAHARMHTSLLSTDHCRPAIQGCR